MDNEPYITNVNCYVFWILKDWEMGNRKKRERERERREQKWSCFY